MNPNVELVKALRKRKGQSDLHAVAADAIEILDKRLADIMDPNIQSMRLEDGKFDMALGGPMVQNVALMMTEWFRESGAKNYVEMTLHARTEPFERYQFYVQKQGDGAKTPHQLRMEVEEQRDALLAALQAVNKLISEAAMTGFNCNDGDWADRLFHSQQATSAAIKKSTGSAAPTSEQFGDQGGGK